MIKKIFFLIPAVFVFLFSAVSQSAALPFSIRLEKKEIKRFPVLQSFAFATSENKWLLIGGRTDGLHRRQPFAAFNEAGMNKFIYLVDLKNEKVIIRELADLPVSLAEQLQSTNMQFYQDGNRLVLTGGYGFSPSTKKFYTHPYITIINIQKLILALEKNKPLSGSFVQLKDEKFAVTGGRLNKLGNIFFLAGGQRFTGRYNPHGSDHGPGFVQQYTNAIRRFSISYKNKMPVITHQPEWYDSLHLHRRDYNLLPQWDGKGNKSLTMFSGVFQYQKNLPFTTLVDITSEKYQLIPGFDQQFNHYHTAVFPLFSNVTASMYSVFFGGIAQKYISSKGDTITDNDVPFVNTISVIERKNEFIKEFVLPVSMDGYLGAAAEFIPASEKYFINGIFMLGGKVNLPFTAGYIVGGINSTGKNIFWENSGEESSASAVIWKVIIE